MSLHLALRWAAPFASFALGACLLLPALARGAESVESGEKTTTEKEGSTVIEDGRTVSIEYTLKLDDGSTADTNVGGDPLVYEQGGSQILPALENELEGMEVNESKQVTLPPEQGYGAVDEDLFQEVEKEVVPEDARKAGTRLISEDPNGNRRMIRVHEVRDSTVVLDLNHPLAGETLHFDVKVLGVE